MLYQIKKFDRNLFITKMERNSYADKILELQRLQTITSTTQFTSLL